MSATYEHSECWICVDCAMWHANGDSTALDIDRELEVTTVSDYFIVDCGDNDEGIIEFSKSRCDACRSVLAGSRFRAWLEVTS